MKTIIRLLTFIRKRWETLFLGFICIKVSTVGGLIIPRLLGSVIDTALGSGNKITIVILGLVIIGTATLRSAGRFGDTYINQLVSQQIPEILSNAGGSTILRVALVLHSKV